MYLPTILASLTIVVVHLVADEATVNDCSDGPSSSEANAAFGTSGFDDAETSFLQKHRRASPQLDTLTSLTSYVDLTPHTKASKTGTTVTHGQFVDVKIGSGEHGHTFPGATTPWGMVQATPWVHSLKSTNSGWDTQSGYHADAAPAQFYGMAHSSLSGAGSGEMGELRLRPLFHDSVARPGPFMDIESVNATPGFFAARISEHNGSDPSVDSKAAPRILIESSATPRGAIHRFTFPPGQARMVEVAMSAVPNAFFGVQLDGYNNTVVSKNRYEGCAAGVISGLGTANSFLCFVVEFDQDFSSVTNRSMETAVAHQKIELGYAPDTTFHFGPAAGTSSQLLARVAISRTTLSNARIAFSEVSGKSFDQIVQEAKDAWEQALGVMRIQSSTSERQRMHYTALYHSMISPNLFSDRDGSYRLQQRLTPLERPERGHHVKLGLSGVESHMPVRHAAANTTMYATFSLWDTYRSLHPLMNLVHTQQSRHFGHSLLAMNSEWGYLPPWQLLASPSNMMEGDGGSITLVAMALHGILDKDTVFLAVSAGRKHPDSDVFARYIDSGEEFEHSVSNALEHGRADNCVAQLAARMGKHEEAAWFQSRADRVFELWDPTQGVFAPLGPRNKTRFLTLQSLQDQSSEYAEGSPLQYAWSAEWNMQKMTDLRGGADEFACQLDGFFESHATASGAPDLSGNIGLASLGNEPVMHTPYLYSLAGFPSRTQSLLSRIVPQLFSDQANGLPGNDDLGAMSAWLAFTMLGFYPVSPCSGEYVIGRPFITSADLTVEGGTLKIRAINQSDVNVYVESVEWNDESLNLSRPVVTHDQLSRGGTLRFVMAERPAGPEYVCPDRVN